jgi:predicted amidohydrolase YtcJ
LIRLIVLLLVAAPVQAATSLITGAHVFDGTGRPASVRDVLIRDDLIVAVARRIERVPPDTRVIDAKGLTLLPGLNDLHAHVAERADTEPDRAPTAPR